MCLSFEAPHIEGKRTKEQACVLDAFLRVGSHWTIPCLLAIKICQIMYLFSESLLLLSPPSIPLGLEINSGLPAVIHSLHHCSAATQLPVMRATAATKEIFAFASTFIENLHVLANGNILLSTLDSPGLLYTVDPKAAKPVATQVANLPSFHNTTGLTGIASLGDDLYAITGGLHTSYAFEEGSMHVYIVSLQTNSVVDDIPVPNTASLNGLAALPSQPHTLLSADSIGGRIIRIDTRTKDVSVVIEDEALHPGAGAALAVGINGLKTRGDFIYFTNSALGTFARVLIDEQGNQAGKIEVLARSPSASEIYDDFAFDCAGNAYVAVHSTAVFKITPDGEQTLLAGGANSSTFQEPTSVALANDQKSIYVSTGGAFAGDPITGGQLVQVWL